MYLRTECTKTGQLRPGDWKNDNNTFKPLVQQGGNRYLSSAVEV